MDKLTDEERRARALTIDQAAAKIKAEYGEALAALGMMPVVARIHETSIQDWVNGVRERYGTNLDPRAGELRREYADLLRSGSASELRFLVAVLSRLLDFNRLESTRWDGLVGEMISVLTSAEMMEERRDG